MHLTTQGYRMAESDVILLLRAPGGSLAILKFKAAARGPLLRLQSDTWNGILYEEVDDAIKALGQMADAHDIAKNNRVAEKLLHVDPLDSHFFLLPPWGRKCFIDAVKRDALFNGQRPVFTDIPPKTQ